MSPKELADNEIDILFEDDDVLFIKVYDRVAMEYYGPKDILDQYNNQQSNYLVISKKDKKSFWIIAPKYGTETILDFDGDYYDFTNVIEIYPQLTKEIIEITNNEESDYAILKLISLGKEYSDREIYNLTDGFIEELYFNEKNPSRSIVILKFDEDEFLNSFEFSNRHFVETIMNSYGTPDFFSYEDSEWVEGYILDYFDSENMNLVKQILKFTNPNLLSRIDDNINNEIAEFLYDLFENEIGYIISDYFDIINESTYEYLKGEIYSDFKNPFLKYNIFESIPFNKYYTTVRVLLKYYNELSDKLIPLVSKDSDDDTLFKELGYRLGEFDYDYDDLYNYMHFDDTKFNTYVNNYLNRILDDIELYPEKYSPKLANFYDGFNNLGYKVDRLYKLPTDPSKSFKIIGLDKEKLRINLLYFGYTVEKRSYSLEEFKNFLSTGELFEHLIWKLKNKL